jgi:hypothetical protein
MAEKKVVYKSADAARAAALAKSQTAFQTMSQWSNPLGANTYTDPNNETTKLYMAFLEATGSAKSLAFQNIYRGLVSQPSPTGKGTAWDYTQSLLRSKGLSKNKSRIPDASDILGITKAIEGSVATNAPDLIAYLQQQTTAVDKVAAKPTTSYNKQVSTALQLKDYNDAKEMVSNAYFAAWGEPINEALIGKFKDAWNTEANLQLPTSTTTSVTTPTKVYDMTKPIIDPKTKKQKVDSNGKPMYAQKIDVNGKPVFEYVTKQNTVNTGEDFTTNEQQTFLANYIASNNPTGNFDPAKIGGLAKTLYDDLLNSHMSNYLDIPDVPSISKIITSIIGSSDKAVSDEILRKYKQEQRDKAAIKYMGIAEYLKQGKDAGDFIKPLIDRVSQFLESDITLADPLMTKLLNFQGEDKKYRLMNDYELEQALINDPRYGKTSRAKNEGINVTQALASKLGRG